MISKKKLSTILASIGFAAISMGNSDCGGTYYAPSLEMRAWLYDFYGNSLSVDFDYYLDITTYGGTRLSYYNPYASSNYSGFYSASEYDLAFYDNNGSQCVNTCVQWDAYGCTVYATDCWSNTYNLNISNISYADAVIGVYTLDGYVAYGSSYNLESYYSSSTNAWWQQDEFDTDLVVAWANAEKSGKPMIKLSGTENTTFATRNAKSAGVIKTGRSKPTLITDLTQLTAAQKAEIAKHREALKLPAAALKNFAGMPADVKSAE